MLKKLLNPENLKRQALGLGGIELMTGLALICFPSVAWNILFCHITVNDIGLSLLAWVGCFVAGVGMFYFVISTEPTKSSLWYAPTIIRSIVSIYLYVSVCRGTLPHLCLGIASYDALVAMHHGFIMRKCPFGC